MKTAKNPGYTRYHPRWYRRRMPIFWWVRKAAYTRFILRELTSLAVGYWALLLLAQGWFLSRGSEAYESFVGWLQHPGVLAVHTLLLFAVLFHAMTWLNLAPKAVSLRIGKWRVPPVLVLGVHYLSWLVASAGIVGLVLWRQG